MKRTNYKILNERWAVILRQGEEEAIHSDYGSEGFI
jgi:hypothetical protein